MAQTVLIDYKCAINDYTALSRPNAWATTARYIRQCAQRFCRVLSPSVFQLGMLGAPQPHALRQAGAAHPGFECMEPELN
jgi:hypothetical protein